MLPKEPELSEVGGVNKNIKKFLEKKRKLFKAKDQNGYYFAPIIRKAI